MTLSNRQKRRETFLSHYFQDNNIQLQALPGDASFRKYYRVIGADQPMMLMEDPPDRPPVPPYVMVEPFAKIAEHLRALGLNAPRIYAQDLDNGLLLIDDFGENTYTKLLNAGESPKSLYELAIDVLIHLHNHPDRNKIDVKDYDRENLITEVMLLVDWYLPAVYGKTLNEKSKAEYKAVWTEILDQLPTDQKTFVLRDYHVDNLMRDDAQSGIEKCALLDFQDGLIGCFAYDVMSLLEDARRSMDENLYDYLLYSRYLPAIKGLDHKEFMRSFYILAAQRHTKVLGIFVRLYKRDEKTQYLRFLPHVHRLFMNAMARDELKPLRGWFENNKIDLEMIPDIERIQGEKKWA